MSDTPPPAEPAKTEDIPLEDIDRLLATEDPEFAKSLEEVRAVASDKDVTIEAGAIDEGLASDEKFEAKPEGPVAKFKFAIKMRLARMLATAKVRLLSLGKDTVLFLRTRPKEFLLYSIAMAKLGYKWALVPLRAYGNASRIQRITGLVMVLCFVGAVWVLLANFRGVWLPQINQPILHTFEPYADHVETYNPKEVGESFYAAFPQERHEFLFPKMKVNLRRTPENPLPMGAFEVIVLLDSKDTAIEVRDREVEFSDLLQRVFEEETFTELESEFGKSKVKSHIKQELDKKLTQGWVKDVNFKNFILKP